MNRNQIAKFVGPEWVDLMAPFMESEEMDNILKALKEAKDAGDIIYPEQKNIFRAFTETPLSKLRLVIMGMDPYPTEGLANGLAFAHLNNMTKPASMKQIIQAVEKDAYSGLNMEMNKFNTELTQWTAQGIMLLNTSLTVKAENAGSHNAIWKPFIEYFVKSVNLVKHNIIWIAWGKQAQEFTKDVNLFLNFIIFAEHPAKASHDEREWNTDCFSKTNAIIIANELGDKIIW